MDIKKPQLVKVGAFAYFFEGVLQHPLYTQMCQKSFSGYVPFLCSSANLATTPGRSPT